MWKSGNDGLVSRFYDGAKRNVDFFLREGADAESGLIEFGYYGEFFFLLDLFVFS